MLHGLAIAAIQFALALSGQSDMPAVPRHHVMLISIDGLRPDAIDAADAAFLKSLIARGSYSPTCRNQFPPSTLPNHTTMLTGKSVFEHAVVFNSDLEGHVNSDTLLDIVTRANRRAAYFASKSKFSYLCRPEAARPRMLESDLESLTNGVIAMLDTEPADFTFIHFNQPDGAGHANGWMSEAYLAEVRRVDGLLRRIFEALTRNKLDVDTVALITADHGGQGKGHFLNTNLERYVPLIIVGPDIASGHALTGPNSLMQLAPLSLALLGLDVPQVWRSRIPADAFADPAVRAAVAACAVAASMPAESDTSAGEPAIMSPPHDNVCEETDAAPVGLRWPCGMVLVGGVLLWLGLRSSRRRR